MSYNTCTSKVSDEFLLKFLCWKQDVKRAADRFHIFQKWRNANSWSHTNLQLSSDPLLKKHVASNVIIAPDSLVTKSGCTVIVGRLRNNDMTDGRTPEQVCRMLLYIIDRVLERESTQENGIVVFHDLSGISKNNIHPGVAKMLLGAIIGHFPLKIKAIYLLNAPFFFKTMFTIVSSFLLPTKLKQRVHYVDSIEDMYEVVDQELLLKEHGGELLFDTDKWVSEQVQREESGDLTSILI